MRKVVAVLVATLCCLLVGCGPSADEERADSEAKASASAAAEASASAEADASASAEADAREAAKVDVARAAQEECQGQMGDLLSALKQLDGRLDVGLTNADLGTRLGDAAVAYNDIPFKQLSPECITGVGIPLEDAYNEYSKSKNAWDACIDDYSCSVEGAKLRELQTHWSKASSQISRAARFMSSPQNYMNTVG